MKRFNFRLEKFLSIKKHHEKEWELKLAHATGACLRIENNIDRNIFEKARTLQSRRIAGAVKIDDLVYSEIYMQRLSWQNRQLENELVIKELERKKIRKGYLEASKERKVLDKLKERQAGDFYKIQRNEEMKSLDDMNNSTYAKRLVYGGKE